MLAVTRAEVAEWQTRRSQKPLGFTARVGSTPTFGTSHPGTRREFRRRGTKHSMTIQRVSPWKYWRSAWAQGQYAYVALPASIPRPVAGLLALLYTLLLLLLPNVYGPLYTLPGGRASVRISPLRGRLRHVAVFPPIALASMTVDAQLADRGGRRRGLDQALRRAAHARGPAERAGGRGHQRAGQTLRTAHRPLRRYAHSLALRAGARSSRRRRSVLEPRARSRYS